jgi:transcriptional regulator with XRE-family HTH domain
MLKLRTSIGLTPADLAARLGVSRCAVGEWEAGLNSPKAEHLQHVLGLGVRASVFTPEQEEEKIRALWKTAQQRVFLEESWLAATGSSISRRGTQCTGLGKSMPDGERFSQDILSHCSHVRASASV